MADKPTDKVPRERYLETLKLVKRFDDAVAVTRAVALEGPVVVAGDSAGMK